MHPASGWDNKGRKPEDQSETDQENASNRIFRDGHNNSENNDGTLLPDKEEIDDVHEMSDKRPQGTK